MSGINDGSGASGSEGRLVETRAFPPPAELAARANVAADAYAAAAADPIAFWERRGRDGSTWATPVAHRPRMGSAGPRTTDGGLCRSLRRAGSSAGA